MIMDWVHCNNCFLLPDRDKCFYLTSCGHIFCRDCEATCAHNVCKLCGNQCTSIPLSSSMKPDVQMYFTDPGELLKAKLKEVQKISMFQKNHRARLMAYYRKELNKYRQMKDAFKKLLKNLKDLESEKKQLSSENVGLKKLIEMSGLTRSLGTPLSSSGVTPGNHGSRKGVSPHDISPSTSRINPMFTQFFSKLDNSGSVPHTTGRVSVFSPPVNGKIGGIPGTPSPSAGLRNLTLSAHLSDQNRPKNPEKFLTPTCSQESSECNFILNPESVTSSPLDAWNIQKNSTKGAYQSKKDLRRVVVHPYSPDE